MILRHDADVMQIDLSGPAHSGRGGRNTRVGYRHSQQAGRRVSRGRDESLCITSLIFPINLPHYILTS
jgi:hypothetical protein